MIYRHLTIFALYLLLMPAISHGSQHNLRISFSNIPTLDCTTAGFRLYNDESIKVCEVMDTDPGEIVCSNIDINQAEATFTLTSFCEDGRESPNSAPFTVTFPSDPSILNAVIEASPATGTAPLEVLFNGGKSTGEIVNYHWTFGDGSDSTDGISVTHRFLESADYTVTLTVSDDKGNESTARYTVSVASGSSDNNPPRVVISSTTTVGDSPLSVTFDGSGSDDADGDPLTYAWNFGDGSTSRGNDSTVTHIYTVPGNYQATLTVSDGTDETTSDPIPVLVYGNEPTMGKPIASIITNRQSGMAPLKVLFDGTGSMPSLESGKIIKYEWDFGDGGTAEGKAASHSFENAGEYIVTLTVTDDKGNIDTTSVRIVAREKDAALEILPLIYKLLLLNNNHKQDGKPSV